MSLLFKLAKILHKRWYWQNIQQKAVILEDCRKTNGKTVRVDIRNFFVNPNSYELQQTVKPYRFWPEPVRVTKLWQWVKRNIKAKPEKGDFWQFPFETLIKKKGDCEDLAILLANLLVASGIKPWKIRLNAGETNVGPHVWVTYFNGKKWVNLDFWGLQPKQVWYSWDMFFAYVNEENFRKWLKK